MSDDEVIKFEITDYDLDNEFNPGRGRKANKEQQIYGKIRLNTNNLIKTPEYSRWCHYIQ